MSKARKISLEEWKRDWEDLFASIFGMRRPDRPYFPDYHVFKKDFDGRFFRDPSWEIAFIPGELFEDWTPPPEFVSDPNYNVDPLNEVDHFEGFFKAMKKLSKPDMIVRDTIYDTLEEHDPELVALQAPASRSGEEQMHEDYIFACNVSFDPDGSWGMISGPDEPTLMGGDKTVMEAFYSVYGGKEAYRKHARAIISDRKKNYGLDGGQTMLKNIGWL